MASFLFSLTNCLEYDSRNPDQEYIGKFGMVINVSQDGKILRSFFDTKGIVLPESGAVKEYNGYLYVGGDVLPYIGKVKLEKT